MLAGPPPRSPPGPFCWNGLVLSFFGIPLLRYFSGNAGGELNRASSVGGITYSGMGGGGLRVGSVVVQPNRQTSATPSPLHRDRICFLRHEVSGGGFSPRPPSGGLYRPRRGGQEQNEARLVGEAARFAALDGEA